jgi:hypothetical protein
LGSGKLKLVEFFIDTVHVQQFLMLESPYYSGDKAKEIFDIIEKAYSKGDIILFGVNCDGDYYFINSRQNIIENLDILGRKDEKVS